METTNKVLALMLLIPGGIILRALVIAKLWLWFIVPLGLGPIGMAHAFGLGVFAQLVSYIYHKPPEDITAVMLALQGCAVSAAMLGVGYVAHLFMG